MLPEISRRCLSCGAAARAGARFCPQCGAQVADAGAAAAGQDAAAPETREVEAPRGAGPTREVESPEEWTPPTREYAAFVQSFEAAAPGARPQASESPSPSAEHEPRRDDGSSSFDDSSPLEAPRSYVAAESPGAYEGAAASPPAGEVRGRVARVREETRARVERMRDEAIVALEETPDDSGLRFVVAAAALFVVFLLLLFLSTTVLR